MMKVYIVSAALLLAPTAILAHPGHAHENPAEQSVIVNNATIQLRQMIASKTRIENMELDLIWVNAEGQVTKQGPGYSIVAFTVGQPQTVYMLMSDLGSFYSANFSGKFEGVE